MARISGVNIPSQKKLGISLTYIYGIGKKTATEICKKSGVDWNSKVSELNDTDIVRVREVIDKEYVVEGDLRQDTSFRIKRLVDIGCYRGIRHRLGLPLRGQRTHTNARTRKGRSLAVAGKKKATR